MRTQLSGRTLTAKALLALLPLLLEFPDHGIHAGVFPTVQVVRACVCVRVCLHSLYAYKSVVSRSPHPVAPDSCFCVFEVGACHLAVEILLSTPQAQTELQVTNQEAFVMVFCI